MSGANYTRVWQIYEVIHPKPDDLISTARFFVREGELVTWDEKKRRKKKRYFFLFNDLLLLTKRENHKKFWLRIHITLRSPNVTVEDVDSASYNNEFRLHCRSRSFIFYAQSPEIRKEWVRDLEMSIKGQHPDEKKDKDLQKKSEAYSKDGDKKSSRKKKDNDDDDILEEEGSSGEDSDSDDKKKKKSTSLKPEGVRNRSKSHAPERGAKRKKIKAKQDTQPSPREISSNFHAFDPFGTNAAHSAGLPRVQQHPSVIHSSPAGDLHGHHQQINPFLQANPYGATQSNPSQANLFHPQYTQTQPFQQRHTSENPNPFAVRATNPFLDPQAPQPQFGGNHQPGFGGNVNFGGNTQQPQFNAFNPQPNQFNVNNQQQFNPNQPFSAQYGAHQNPSGSYF